MKKRKIKLFASIASLALVVAVMGVGVWAASSQAATVTSKVSFSSTSIGATITLLASDARTAETTTAWASQAATAKAHKILEKVGTTADEDAFSGSTAGSLFTIKSTDAASTSYTEAIAVSLKDYDDDGFILKGETFTYEFTITPTSGTAAIFYQVKIALPADHANIKAEFDKTTHSTGTSEVASGTNAGKYLVNTTAASSAITVKIVFTVLGEWDSTLSTPAYKDIASTLTNVDLPTIKFDFRSSEAYTAPTA